MRADGKVLAAVLVVLAGWWGDLGERRLELGDGNGRYLKREIFMDVQDGTAKDGPKACGRIGDVG